MTRLDRPIALKRATPPAVVALRIVAVAALALFGGAIAFGVVVAATTP